MSWSAWGRFPNTEGWTLAILTEVQYDIGHTQIDYPVRKSIYYNYRVFHVKFEVIIGLGRAQVKWVGDSLKAQRLLNFEFFPGSTNVFKFDGFFVT